MKAKHNRHQMLKEDSRKGKEKDKEMGEIKKKLH
jgi:hypothetical protein